MGFAGVEGKAGHGSCRLGHQYAAGIAVRESGAAETNRGTAFARASGRNRHDLYFERDWKQCEPERLSGPPERRKWNHWF
jgi:hypothetical protein